MYYLACGFCRWTTRDIGLPDQNVASGGWPEPENPDAARFASLQDHYRSIAQREKLEKESRRFLGRKLSYMQLADKYGLSAAVARRKAGLPPIVQRSPAATDNTSFEGAKTGGQAVSVAPSQAKCIEEVEVLDMAELFAKTPDLCRTTRLEQRLMQIDSQPISTADVYPRHKHLVVKRSQRCRICEHNLSKPEYNPTSIKFKIQLAAFYHVPEAIIFHLSNQPLKAGEETNFILKVTNPAQHPTYVELLDLDDYFHDQEISNNNPVEKDNEKGCTPQESKGIPKILYGRFRRRFKIHDTILYRHILTLYDIFQVIMKIEKSQTTSLQELQKLSVYKVNHLFRCKLLN